MRLRGKHRQATEAHSQVQQPDGGRDTPRAERGAHRQGFHGGSDSLRRDGKAYHGTHAQPEVARQGILGVRHGIRHRTGWLGQDVHQHSPGREGVEEQGDTQDNPVAPRSGGRRETRIPAGRHEGQDRPLPATPVRRTGGHDSTHKAEGDDGTERDTDSATGLHEGTHAERCRGDTGRGAEYHAGSDKDVPHTHGEQHQDDSDGRHDANRPPSRNEERTQGGLRGAARREGNRLRGNGRERHRPPQTRDADSEGIREARQEP